MTDSLERTTATHETFSASTVARLFGVRVLVGSLAGYWHTVALWHHLHYAAIGLGAVAVLALVAPAIRAGGSRRWLAIWAGVGSALAFAACFAEPAVVPHLKLDVFSSLTRYDVLASLLMLTARSPPVSTRCSGQQTSRSARLSVRISSGPSPSTSSAPPSHGLIWNRPSQAVTRPSPTLGGGARVNSRKASAARTPARCGCWKCRKAGASDCPALQSIDDRGANHVPCYESIARGHRSR